MTSTATVRSFVTGEAARQPPLRDVRVREAVTDTAIHLGLPPLGVASHEVGHGSLPRTWWLAKAILKGCCSSGVQRETCRACAMQDLSWLEWIMNAKRMPELHFEPYRTQGGEASGELGQSDVSWGVRPAVTRWVAAAAMVILVVLSAITFASGPPRRESTGGAVTSGAPSVSTDGLEHRVGYRSRYNLEPRIPALYNLAAFYLQAVSQ